MKIGPVDSGERPQRPDNEERRKIDVNPNEARPPDPTDKVEISREARSLSENTSAGPDETGEAASADDSGTTEDIHDLENRPEKIEQARERIKSGYYDSPEVKEEIARRITDDFAG